MRSSSATAASRCIVEGGRWSPQCMRRRCTATPSWPVRFVREAAAAQCDQRDRERSVERRAKNGRRRRADGCFDESPCPPVAPSRGFRRAGRFSSARLQVMSLEEHIVGAPLWRFAVPEPHGDVGVTSVQFSPSGDYIVIAQQSKRPKTAQRAEGPPTSRLTALVCARTQTVLASLARLSSCSPRPARPCARRAFA